MKPVFEFDRLRLCVVGKGNYRFMGNSQNTSTQCSNCSRSSGGHSSCTTCSRNNADVKLIFVDYFVCHCTGVSGVSGDKGLTGDKGPTGDSGEYGKKHLGHYVLLMENYRFLRNNIIAQLLAIFLRAFLPHVKQDLLL